MDNLTKPDLRKNSKAPNPSRPATNSFSAVKVAKATPPTDKKVSVSAEESLVSHTILRKSGKEKYEHQHAECDGLCDIDPKRIDKADDTKMPCVTCPFCKEIVTAELTPSTIHCPACKVTVNR